MPEGVVFEEEEQESAGPRHAFKNRGAESGIARWLVAWGFVASVEQAHYVLMGVVVLCFAASVTIFGIVSGWFTSEEPRYREDLSAQERAAIPPEVFESLPSRQAF